MGNHYSRADIIYIRILVQQYSDGFGNVERDNLIPEFGLTIVQARMLIETWEP